MIKFGRRNDIKSDTYIGNLKLIILHILNALKTDDKQINKSIEEYKNALKKANDKESLEHLKYKIADFVIKYDESLSNNKKQQDKLILANINMLIRLAKETDSSKNWQNSLEKIKESLKEKIDLNSLEMTKEILFSLGTSAKNVKETIYKDMLNMLFSLMDISAGGEAANKYKKDLQDVKQNIMFKSDAIESIDIRQQLKTLISAKETIEDGYIDSLNNKLNKAIKALVYGINTFSASHIKYSDVFKEHLEEIDSMAQNIDVDTVSKQLIAISIKMKNSVSNMQKRLDQYEQKVKEASGTIQELQDKIKEARANLIVDQLTKIYNRRGLMHFIKLERDRALRYKTPFSIIMSDIDHFSNVNNTYGHLVGDKVLQMFCSTIKSIVRDVDILTRYGGEEFILILPSTGVGSAFEVSEKLRAAVSKLKFQYKGENFQITSSFGVAQFRETDSVKSLIKRVDDALYRAKSTRNKTVKED